MKNPGVVQFPVRSAVQSMTLKVRVRGGLAAFRLRLWIGMRLLRLSAWVIGMPIEIDFDGQKTG